MLNKLLLELKDGIYTTVSMQKLAKINKTFERLYVKSLE